MFGDFSALAMSADVVFAAVDAVDAYRGGMYGEEDSGMTRKVVLGGLVVVVIWICLYAFDRFQKAKKIQAAKEAKSLFGELCSTHRLTADERQKLEAIARQASLTPPEAIFLAPEAFDKAAGSGQESKVIQMLRTKIFGDIATA